MNPVRPTAGDAVDARTERISVSTAVEIPQLVAAAREFGLVWLREQHLSDPSHPDHLANLLAVMRIDLADTADRPARLTEYRRVFPALRVTPEGRRVVGEVARHRVVRVVADRAAERSDSSLNPVTENTPPPILISPPSRVPVSKSEAGSRDVPELDPAVAAELGFTDLVRLGQGGFGTVFAARQPGVGNRLVAIKYTVARSRESQVLAALQHPNIMPVWSVHELGGHRVFCMPLHGRSTLADVLLMIDRTKSLPATGAGFLSAGSVAEVDDDQTLVEPDVDLPAGVPEYESDRRRLKKLGYVESVVQGVTRLADALAHAHRRRVIHLDIKPANILITDDGGFMILDFGLAYQNGLPASPEGGGTVRYMAPEQLTMFVSGKGVRPDPRMDLYALGLVFFELLTGRHPFAESLAPGVRREEWVAARHRHPPRVRRFNPSVPPGVEAIVLKLLHPDRGLRYQSAEQALADLNRQQDDQPLLHAGNPSGWERFLKFRRRHPVFSVAVMAVMLALLAVAGFAAANWQAEKARSRELAAQTTIAEQTLTKIHDGMTAVRIDAGSPLSPEVRKRAIAQVERWRTVYALDQPADWTAGPGFARLSPDEQAALRAALGEHALLAAHAERLNALAATGNERDDALRLAVLWNHRAKELFPLTPTAVVEQRQALERLLDPALPAAPSPPAVGPTDLYLRSLGLLADNKPQEAINELLILVEEDSHHAAGQFTLGYAYQLVGDFDKAVERYQVAKALADRDYRPAFYRGKLQLFRRHTDEAIADFTTAIDREPLLAEVYYQRATARYQRAMLLKKGEQEQAYKAALADLDREIERGGPRYKYVCVRGMVRAKLGDAAGAQDDDNELAAISPSDEEDFLIRGIRRNAEAKRLDALAGFHTDEANRRVAASDGRTAVVLLRVARSDARAARGYRLEALADFREATRLNPKSASGWNNRAAIESVLGRTDEAVSSLRKLLQVVPGHTSAKFELAVLLARQKKQEEAVKLVERLTPPDAYTWYQRAAVYALGSVVNFDHRNEAFHSLKMARRAGYDLTKLDDDKDFELIRDLPDVRALIEGAKE